jgi:CO/xanthine dehydrogenase Mo-binding subunit
MYDYLPNTKALSERVGAKNGNVNAALAGAAKQFATTYRWPFQMDGMLSPSCAVADVQNDRATIWSGSQAPFITRNGVPRLLRIPDANVHFIYREGAACFGVSSRMMHPRTPP